MKKYLNSRHDSSERSIDCNDPLFLLQYEQLKAEIRWRDNLTIIAGSIMITAPLLLLSSLMRPQSGSSFESKVLTVTAALAVYSIWFLCFNLTSKKLDRLEYQRLRKMEKAGDFRLHLFMLDKVRTTNWWNFRRHPAWLYMFYTLSIAGLAALYI